MKRHLIPVKDHPDLARDERTGMIVNINKRKHDAGLKSAEVRKKQIQEIDQIKTDVSEIKQMLQKLLENGTNG
jgi:hypothetical protein